jgi:hypothetical protein
MANVTVKGWVLHDLPGGKAVVFMWEGRRQGMETEVLPKSQITVKKTDPFVDEVTMPEWLAKAKGFV